MMYQNQAGKMGAAASQPAKRKGNMSVDPLERLNQRMAGRTHGGSLEGVKTPDPKKKTSLMRILGNM